MMWAGTWIYAITDSPSKNNLISKEELDYLTTTIGNVFNIKVLLQCLPIFMYIFCSYYEISSIKPSFLETNNKINKISFTPYGRQSTERVGRGNLVLRHSVTHFPRN